MKTLISSFLILAAATFVADARIVNTRGFRELDNKADIVVVAKVISTKDTLEQTNLAHISPKIAVVGVSSEFEVKFVLKGDNNLKNLVVHHYRFAEPNRRIGFGLAAFDPRKSMRYLLFLRREPDGRYAPHDQVDPAVTSIFTLSGPEWDKMQFEDFKEWIDAKRWVNDRIVLGPPTLTPKIPNVGTGENSLFEAALNGKLEKAKVLISANPDLVFSHEKFTSDTPLHLAVEFDRRNVAELLLANKADIEAKDNGDQTPLLRAVSAGHKGMVEWLLANKADVNAKNRNGWSPLYAAAATGYTDIAALLLANGANVNVKTGYETTPLHIAAAHGFKDMVELLLANKADINVKDNRGYTPLHFAATHGETDMVKMLLANKADINATNNAGETPLQSAKSTEERQTPNYPAEMIQAQKDVEELLRQHGGRE